tara:strand:- start:626 stop:808 length:183 start_codon:yes stop_codon:yes gene_type:complete
MIKLILLTLTMSTFAFASTERNMPPVPTIQQSIDDDYKIEARRRGGKGNKKRRRGGNGLR